MYGLTITNIRVLAYDYAKKIGATYPENWNTGNKAGEDWYAGFIKRHPRLSLRTPQQFSTYRIKGFTRITSDYFFELYDEVLAKYKFVAADIYNMDETGFTNVPAKVQKVVAQKGSKHVGVAVAQERGSLVTLALAINACGQYMPPFFIFPQKKMSAIFLERAAPSSEGVANGSGWMRGPDFLLYMQHFVRHAKATKDTPKLLLLDNHQSHMSLDALVYAEENGVVMLTFPPHCSHRMQPLDRAVYASVKKSYVTQCNAWSRGHVGQSIAIRHIPELVSASLDVGATPANIKSGFRVTGIWPFNPEIFAESDFLQATISGENECAEAADGTTCEPVSAPTAEAAPYDPTLEENELNDFFYGQVAAIEEVTTSEPSTSIYTPTSGSLSNISMYADALDRVGPLHSVPPVKKSNRGRKAGTSVLANSPENLARLKARRTVSQAPKRGRGRPRKTFSPILSTTTDQEPLSTPSPQPSRKRGRPSRIPPLNTPAKQKSKRTTAKKQPARRAKAPPPPSTPVNETEDRDFCLICLKLLPAIQNEFNVISCDGDGCTNSVHLRCANPRASFYTCPHCDVD